MCVETRRSLHLKHQRRTPNHNRLPTKKNTPDSLTTQISPRSAISEPRFVLIRTHKIESDSAWRVNLMSSALCCKLLCERSSRQRFDAMKHRINEGLYTERTLQRMAARSRENESGYAVLLQQGTCHSNETTCTASTRCWWCRSYWSSPGRRQPTKEYQDPIQTLILPIFAERTISTRATG